MRYTSDIRIGSLPLLDIAIGADAGRGEEFGYARGVIAIGDIAAGGLSIGVLAIGGISIGICAAGVIAIGALAAGIWSTGIVAFALIEARGGLMSVGYEANGKNGLSIREWLEDRELFQFEESALEKQHQRLQRQ